MKILTAAQMREIDRRTVESCGVPSLLLMENAGVAVVEFLERKFPKLGKERITILCGPGNNGGDGFVVARQLHQRGVKPRTVLFGDPERLKGDAAANFRMLVKVAGPPTVVKDTVAWKSLQPELASTTLFIDSIFGTGLSRPLEGFYGALVADLRASFQGREEIRWVAVDLPSGIPSDDGQVKGEFLRADYTVTFTAPKAAHVFPPACGHLGEWEVKTIGTPATLLESNSDLFMNYTDAEAARRVLKPRALDSHKGTFGHVLLVAGSRGKTGAAALAAQAAQRAGAGLVTVAAPESAVSVIASEAPEFMTAAMPETGQGTLSLKALEGDRFDKLVEGKTVLAVGPGLTTEPETAEVVRRIVEKYDLPLVLDADGLNAFSIGKDEVADKLKAKGRTRVLTPHPGEMGRLCGVGSTEVQSRRVEVARAFASKNQLHVILKGFRTLTAAPDGQVWVNGSGNPGMATGGAGDVLTGIVAGMLARYSGQPVTEVVAAAVYLHGAAGDAAAENVGQEALIASDILNHVPEALLRIKRPD